MLKAAFPAESQEPASSEPVVDARGYGDLLSYLFPPVGKIRWHSVEYPVAASRQAAEGAHDGLQVPVRPHVWETVLRAWRWLFAP